MNYLFFKRAFDIVFASSMLLVLSPLFLLTAIAIKLDSKGPVFFLQDRLGVNGAPFKFFKFRSMFLGAEKLGVYEVKDDPRVTRVGRVLRKYSINELPQLINILKGEMSLIGPRPVLSFHPWPYSDYTDEQKKRFFIKPGLTGWAQVNGRKNVDWDQRLKYDVEYAENCSFFFDARIFFKTFLVVLSASDNYNKTETARGKNVDKT